MFNFKLTPIWLFAIVLIVLIISMMWYNNASIEGFETDKELLNYPNNGLIKFGVGGNYFDSKTGNIIRDYDQTFTVINRGGGRNKYIKSDLSGNIDVNIEEQLKNQTYGAFSMYEATNDEQLFYVSMNDDTFIHSISSAGHKSYVFNPGRYVKEEQSSSGPLSFDTSTSTTPTMLHITTSATPKKFTDTVFDGITGHSIPVKELVGGLFYDSSNGIVITRVAENEDVKKERLMADLNQKLTEYTDLSISPVLLDGETSVISAMITTLDVNIVAGNLVNEEGITIDPAPTAEAIAKKNKSVEVKALANSYLTHLETMEGFTTMNHETINIYNRVGETIMQGSSAGAALTDEEWSKYTSYAPVDGGDSLTDSLQSTVIVHDNVQLVMITYLTNTVLIVLEKTGTSEKSKYNFIGTLRYDGSTLVMPIQAPTESTPQLEDAVSEGDEKEGDEKNTDLTESSMSEYWKWFHYWNAGGSGSGSNQPMSQDYMLKTEHVPSTCPSCSGKDCGGGACANCGGGDSCGGGRSGGGGGKGGGGLLGTGGVANNVINTTGDLAEKVVDTGAGLAAGAVVGGAIAAGAAVDIGREVASGTVGIGREVASGGRDAVGGAVGLGKDVVGGAVGLGKDAVGGAVNLGREVASGGKDAIIGAANLGRDAVGGTANFIKNTQNNGNNSGAGGYASGGGNMKTRKYVSGQQTTGGTDPYTYNGALAKRGGSNFMPLTADFSSF